MLSDMQASCGCYPMVIFHHIAHDKQYCTNMFIMRLERLSLQASFHIVAAAMQC